MEIIIGVLVLFVVVSVIGKLLKLAFKVVGFIFIVLLVLFLAGMLGFG